MFDREQYQKRVAWYQHDRFGMFIHWGFLHGANGFGMQRSCLSRTISHFLTSLIL